VTFAATFRGKTVTVAPVSVEVRANIGVRVNPNFMRTPVLKSLLDRSTTTAATIDLSAGLRPTFPAGHFTETAYCHAPSEQYLKDEQRRAPNVRRDGSPSSRPTVCSRHLK